MGRKITIPGSNIAPQAVLSLAGLYLKFSIIPITVFFILTLFSYFLF